MAPANVDNVDDRLKDVIQNLYEIQSAVHGYLGPETQLELVRKISSLSNSLSNLSATGSTLSTQIPPEIIEYVDSSRNPDIYTREFVELVQKGNQQLKGKAEAFGSFRDALAEEINAAMPELKEDVTLVLSGASTEQQPVENGSNRRN